MSILSLSKRNFSLLIKSLKLNFCFLQLKTSASADKRSIKNNLQKAFQDNFCLVVDSMTMNISVWFTTVLLVLIFNITNLLNLEDLIILILIGNLRCILSPWDKAQIIDSLLLYGKSLLWQLCVLEIKAVICSTMTSDKKVHCCL